MGTLIVTIVLTTSLILAARIFVYAMNNPPSPAADERGVAFWAFKLTFSLAAMIWIILIAFLQFFGVMK